MPLKPLQITKNVQTDDTRISPGAVVTYEQHSKTLLGVVLGEKAGKWLLTNQQGAEVSLPAARLALLYDFRLTILLSYFPNEKRFL